MFHRCQDKGVNVLQVLNESGDKMLKAKFNCNNQVYVV